MSLLLNSRGKEAHSGLVMDTTEFRLPGVLVILVISRYKSPRPLFDIEGSAEAGTSRVGPAVKKTIEGHIGEFTCARALGD